MTYSDKQFRFNFEIYMKKHFSDLKIIKSKFNTARIDLSLNSIWRFDSLLTKTIFSFPEKSLYIAETSLNQFIYSISNFKKNFFKPSTFFKLNLLGPFGHIYNPIISLGASCIGELICVKGLVVHCGNIKVKQHHSIFFCNKNQKLYLKSERNKKIFNDIDSIENTSFSNMEIEYGLSEFFEQQKIILKDVKYFKNMQNFQKNLVVYVCKDLTSKFYLGDELELCGIFKPLKVGNLSEKFNIFETCLHAISVKKLLHPIDFLPNKLDNLLINYFSMFSDCFERLSSLVIPQIQGINLIKKGILLSLVYSNTTIKTCSKFFIENINILFIGDHDLIKNELLSFISKIFSIYSINNYDLLISEENQNKETSSKINFVENLEKTFSFFKYQFVYLDNLEILTRKEKLLLGELFESNFDINGIKESVVFNHSNPSKIGWVKTREKFFNNGIDIQKNIEFPGLLYDQFDLFLLLPETELASIEKNEAKLVLNNHRRSTISTISHHKSIGNFMDNTKYFKTNDHEKLEKFDKKNTSINFKAISENFLRNYIFYAKEKIKCHFSREVIDFLIKKYYLSRSNLKKFEKKDIQTIEKIIRLCIAYAKCHLRSLVSISDIEYIEELLETQKNIKFQTNKNFKSQVIKNKKILRSKHIGIFSELKKNEEFNYKWSRFVLKKQEKIRYFNCTLKSLKIQVTTFQLKNKFEENRYKSFIERALSIWNYKNVCIIIGKDIIKIQ